MGFIKALINLFMSRPVTTPFIMRPQSRSRSLGDKLERERSSHELVQLCHSLRYACIRNILEYIVYGISQLPRARACALTRTQTYAYSHTHLNRSI